MEKAAPLFEVGESVRVARVLHPGTEHLVGRRGTIVAVDEITAEGVRLQVNYDVEFEPGDQRYLHAEELVGITEDGERDRARFLALVGKMRAPGGIKRSELAEAALYVNRGLQGIVEGPQVPPEQAEAAAFAALYTASLLLFVSERQ